MTITDYSREARHVRALKPDRPYFEAWLRRTARQLSVSGRMSEVSILLSRETGETSDEWRERLRDLLEGNEVPSLELLTRIDALLAGPPPALAKDDEQESLLF